ncbi:MAG TPA: 3-deoxy-7-phosphoheptulonate synthase [Bacteroidales bacterium]|nr:MAG: 3-deoxy-7-phosphoheptulonate synthase [Bacteroidetes bacterium GWF2_33_38]OFY74174.1 MAG: 3-deoxy-7-phosphoheptulonate synthase [Bacteroidetes bacterium RIFOXYA12_FULL_33_9]OFY87810.1 MAG: 3-deoxy-7-phosphoheptulonate synthase [Bacteroidetes bacterium RIFOXYA2_FULL_33_7]HBF88193.1 3-deoxy-7-phosphoheptulonate synthase [Bacteroidales bacterium]
MIFTPINTWFAEEINQPLFICGPCSAESEEQVLKTAIELQKEKKINVYRAGIWKPRTRPGTFEGKGIEALTWLQEVKRQTNLRVAVEVASPFHVEACIEKDVDIIWIGARTTSNPFSVQEIANSLKGINIPVLIKNPINPDLDFWIGAIERIYDAGIRKIAAVHRGFYPFEKTSLRNIPKWEIPIELKTRFNDLPMICDPSHISGSREFIEEISQKALDLNFDGLMIESHINPEKALSDASQQLKPDDAIQLINRLIVRSISIENEDFANLLCRFRDQIDSIDSQLLQLLSQRMNVVREIGKYKKYNNVTVFQIRRWQKIIETRMLEGKKIGLSEKFIAQLLELIHKESIQEQAEIMKKKEN